MLFITSKPERVLRDTSIKTISGRLSSLSAASASSPSPASATTSISGSRLISIAMPCRSMAWSSTSITFDFKADMKAFLIHPHFQPHFRASFGARQDIQHRTMLPGAILHDFNAHPRGRPGFRAGASSGKAAAVVAYRQPKRPLLQGQRNCHMFRSSVAYPVVDGLLRDPVKVERQVIIADHHFIFTQKLAANLVGGRDFRCKRLQRGHEAIGVQLEGKQPLRNLLAQHYSGLRLCRDGRRNR